MKITLTRRYGFCASHRLHTGRLSDAENQRLYGKCNNPYGHGHDYILKISVTGQPDQQTGLLVRVADLDYLVASEILCAVAHRNLNADVAEFQQLAPTTENLALVVAERLSRRWTEYFADSAAWLSAVGIQETDRNSVELLLPDRLADMPRTSNLSVLSIEGVTANA